VIKSHTAALPIRISILTGVAARWVVTATTAGHPQRRHTRIAETGLAQVTTITGQVDCTATIVWMFVEDYLTSRVDPHGACAILTNLVVVKARVVAVESLRVTSIIRTAIHGDPRTTTSWTSTAWTVIVITVWTVSTTAINS
jgi:hypothetical protein